jgi:ABC-2 type transport system ATP-binding protein
VQARNDGKSAVEEAVWAEGVSKRFGPVVALNDINLVVSPGEVVAILGPNGAGKTTLINLMLGLLTPTAGRISVYGRAPRQAVADGLVGAMLQETALPDYVTGRQLLGHLAHLYPRSLEPAVCIREAGVGDWADRRLEQLSGGQRRRIAFAASLIGRPRLLFLDEPTQGLDIQARQEFWQHIRAWCVREQATVCFSTHDLGEADREAQRIVLLNRGVIAADGRPDELKRRLGSTRVAFQTTRPRNPEELSQWLRAPVTPSPQGFEVWTSDIDGVIRKLAADPNCHSFRTMTQDLEDVFRELTREAGVTAE